MRVAIDDSRDLILIIKVFDKAFHSREASVCFGRRKERKKDPE